MACFSNSFVPDPRDTALPAKIRFDAEVVAADGKSKDRSLEIRLADGNALTFPGGAKSLTKLVKVGSKPVPVTFRTTVSGDPGDAGLFRVTLFDEEGSEIDACFVSLS